MRLAFCASCQQTHRVEQAKSATCPTCGGDLIETQPTPEHEEHIQEKMLDASDVSSLHK
jgi:hypothetical protein